MLVKTSLAAPTAKMVCVVSTYLMDTTRLRHAGEDKRTWRAREGVEASRPKPLLRGMATVGKELSTHLNAWKAIFFGLLTGIIPSQEVEAPCALGRAAEVVRL